MIKNPGTNPVPGSLMIDDNMASDLDYEELVNRYYQPLYRFAFSLCGREEQASDLTQETFLVWQTKGHQLRDPTKVKTWLFSTLHHEFLNAKRHETRFPHQQLEEADLPQVVSNPYSELDGKTVVEALNRVEQPHQAAVALFYLEQYSYREIAEILGVPIGTVKSRLARGLGQLQAILCGTEKDKLALNEEP